MSTADRMSEGYEPRFDIDYALGMQGQLFVTKILDGIAEGRVEVKTDERALDTGNLFVEYECRKFGGWDKSGIATTAAEYWAFVIGGDAVVIVPTARLKAAARRLGRQAYFRRECSRGSHPTKGIAVPLKTLFLEARDAGDTGCGQGSD